MNQILERRNNPPILYDLQSYEEGGDLVIFCHGYKGYKDWGAWNLVSKQFVNKGMSFLKFNFSLNGGTMDDPIDFPDLEAFGRNTYSQEVRDLNDVIDFVKSDMSFDRIHLIGHSRGGGIVTLVAGQRNDLASVTSWAGVADFKSRFPRGNELKNWKDLGVRYVLNGRTKQSMPHYYSFYEDFIQNESLLDIDKWASRIEIPHLIVHGDDDMAVLIEEAKALHLSNTSSELYTLKANHTFGSRHPWDSSALPDTLKNIVEITQVFMLRT